MDREAGKNLRIPFSGRGRKITLLVDGRPCVAHEGETVHAALLAAGIRTLRTAGKTGEPRGIFCGMGICCECRVTINGVPDQLACMTLAADSMQIETR
jgi:predicted molibdopterin-dependent oxidoreductase YjgC